MSETEGTVTFVGGHAIEQHTASESNVEPDIREKALEAVREAVKKAGEDSAEDAASGKAKNPFKPEGASEKIEVERGPDGKFVAKTEGTPAPKASKTKETKEEPASEDSEDEIDVTKASVKQLLKAREKVAAVKKEASQVKDSLARERQQIAKDAAQLREAYELLQGQQRALEEERKRVSLIKSDPARAVREIGLDPEEFILNLAQEGTPEGKAKREYQALQQQIAEVKAWKEEQDLQIQNYKAFQQQRQVEAIRQRAVNDFLTLGMSEEKYPLVSSFYKGQEKALVALGDIYSEEFRHLSGGREGSYDQILDYIEDELAERVTNWYKKNNNKNSETKSQKDSEGASVKNQKTGQSQGSKGKSLNPEVSAERRTLTQKDLRDLDADERIEAAKQAVAVAVAASRSRSED